MTQIQASEKTYIEELATNQLRNLMVICERLFLEFNEESQADEMAKYDPYSIRRKKVQKAGAAGIMTLGGVFARRPDIVLQAGSTALAQIQLDENDNALEFLQNTFKDKGIGLDAFTTMIDHSRNIKTTVSDFT